MKPALLLRKIHKWIGLIIGIQILLWFVSGLVMSWFDIDTVRGDHLLKTTEKVGTLDLPQSLLAFQSQGHPVVAAELVYLMSDVFVLVDTGHGQALFDPRTKKIISPLTKAHVNAIIESQLAQATPIIETLLLDEVPAEVRGRPAPIWQVQLADDDNSRIYLSPVSGQVLAKRTDTWRLFDFFWMLHIMDYDERSDFNHPLLIISTLLALFVAVSGIWLLFYTIKLKRKKTL